MPVIQRQTNSQIAMPKVLVGLIVATLVDLFAGFIFGKARRLGWTLSWIYVGIIVATLIINLMCMMRWNPALVRRRVRFGKFTKACDMVWDVLFALAMITIYRATVEKAPNGGSQEPGVGWLQGLAICSPDRPLAIWPMVVNPFFEKKVRIQTDHVHRLIDIASPNPQSKTEIKGTNPAGETLLAFGISSIKDPTAAVIGHKGLRFASVFFTAALIRWVYFDVRIIRRAYSNYHFFRIVGYFH